MCHLFIYYKYLKHNFQICFFLLYIYKNMPSKNSRPQHMKNPNHCGKGKRSGRQCTKWVRGSGKCLSWRKNKVCKSHRRSPVKKSRAA